MPARERFRRQALTLTSRTQVGQGPEVAHQSADLMVVRRHGETVGDRLAALSMGA